VRAPVDFGRGVVGRRRLGVGLASERAGELVGASEKERRREGWPSGGAAANHWAALCGLPDAHGRPLSLLAEWRSAKSAHTQRAVRALSSYTQSAAGQSNGSHTKGQVEAARRRATGRAG